MSLTLLLSDIVLLLVGSPVHIYRCALLLYVSRRGKSKYSKTLASGGSARLQEIKFSFKMFQGKTFQQEEQAAATPLYILTQSI
jgi:hypothetical protein